MKVPRIDLISETTGTVSENWLQLNPNPAVSLRLPSVKGNSRYEAQTTSLFKCGYSVVTGILLYLQ